MARHSAINILGYIQEMEWVEEHWKKHTSA